MSKCKETSKNSEATKFAFPIPPAVSYPKPAGLLICNMAFKQSEIEDLLVKCQRRCCICHKYCGVNIEINHIKPKAQEGSDDIDNAIPLCFECHAEVNHYNDEHPKGRKFTEEEQKKHRDQWIKLCNTHPEISANVPRDRDVGPLEGMVSELEFNIGVVRLLTGGSSHLGRFGCMMLNRQYQRAIHEGAILLLPENLRSEIISGYIQVGQVNTFVQLFFNTRPDGNAHAEAQNKLLQAIRDSEVPIGTALNNLKGFLAQKES